MLLGIVLAVLVVGLCAYAGYRQRRHSGNRTIDDAHTDAFRKGEGGGGGYVG